MIQCYKSCRELGILVIALFNLKLLAGASANPGKIQVSNTLLVTVEAETPQCSFISLFCCLSGS